MEIEGMDKLNTMTRISIVGVGLPEAEWELQVELMYRRTGGLGVVMRKISGFSQESEAGLGFKLMDFV
jgi:hypothetical protein